MFPVGQGKYERLVDEDDHLHQDTNLRGNRSFYTKKGAWDHIQNLDQFFSDIYKYHQSGGFTVILLAQILWLVKFIFVIFITIELSVCTRWNYLTNNSLYVQNWTDVFQPPNQCWASLPFFASLLVVGSVITILIQIIIVSVRLSRFWEIRRFCTHILSMPSNDIGLADLTWSEVQQRLLRSQRDFQFCVYKVNLDELDIYNRILRHKNYLIAMINQDIIPIRFRIPSSFNPQLIYLPDGYVFNLKLILFWTPWSPFHNYWQLRADYKWVTKRHELAVELATRIRILGLINLLMAPIIFIAQLIAFICANAERLRHQPSTMFGRRWSNYAHLYLRHFNELQHEFETRLKQAYLPASRYLDSFVSRPLTVLAEAGAFIFGGASVAFFIAGLIREQMMHLPGYLAILVGGGLLARSCLSLIPDDNMVYCPRSLLVSTLMRIHYMPDHWKEQAGTYQVRSEFSQLFQYRMIGLLEELFSPIITPLILIFILPNHTLEIVDFLRNYTVEVPGVGDVCSFAQLDIRRHGDPMWQPNAESGSDDQSETDNDDHTNEIHSCSVKTIRSGKQVEKKIPAYNASEQNEDTVEANHSDSIQHSAAGGKIELSLMHFHLTNPSWRLPPDGLAYLKSVRNQALLDLQQQQQQQQLDQFQDNYKNNTQTGRIASQPAPGMFSTLYGRQESATTSIYRSTYPQLPNSSCIENSGGVLKNVSHLPGSGLVSENTYGVVGAMAESMRSSGSQSMHRSGLNLTEPQMLEPGVRRVSHSDIVTNTLPPCTSYNVSKTAPETNVVPQKSDSDMIRSQLGPALFNYSMLDGPTPITMSLMAASALHSADNMGLPFYQPYNSQIEDGLSQHTGFNNSLIGSVGGRRCTVTEVLTADMSVSALYIHELFHRRRRQRQNHDSTRGYSSQRGMTGSTPGVNDQNNETSLPSQSSNPPGVGVYSTSGYLPGYQLSHGSYTNNSTTLPGSRNTMEYGPIYPTSPSCEPGIIRTPSDGRRIPSSHFTDVTEEDDESVGTPRSCRDTNVSVYIPGSESHIIRYPSGQTTTGGGGIITLSGSPSVRPQHGMSYQNIQQASDPSLSSVPNIDSDLIWPDLPPTNC
ncbi:unnamed protein product [Schistosoma turkestanicum]|nr:unnamed protein product [Schistosoma turkestanicum]